VTGAVACLQGIYRVQSGGETLSGSTLAAILRETGTPQQGSDLIGPRPNLAAAIPLMLDDLAAIGGLVTDADSGRPLAGVALRILENGCRAVTSLDGRYTIVSVPGTWTVRAERFGYAITESEVTVEPASETTWDVALAPLPLLTVSGEVRTQTGAPVAGAEVVIADTPLPAVFTAEDGTYAMENVPAPLNGVVTATAVGLTPDTREIMLLDTPLSVDLSLGFPDDFEASGGGFSGSGSWEWGTPTYAEGPDAHSGSHCWGTNLDGVCGGGSHRLTSPTYDLTAAENPRLAFWHWYSIWAPFDGINVRVAVDGSSNWEPIEPVGGYSDPCIYMLDGQPCEPGWTGTSEGWVPAVFDLNEYIGHSVRFRFHVATWIGGTTGWYIDDLAVYSTTQSTAVETATTSVSTYLKAPWPTPTGGPVTVAWGLAQPAQVTLEVYDLSGRRVRTLMQEALPAGDHNFIWDGRDADGRRAGQGVYLVRMRYAGAEGHNGALSRKVLLLR
jgi:hypothetical protein